jgi:phospholysine phosphohistidine inorganic pyrophosphate phosphatase
VIFLFREIPKMMRGILFDLDGVLYNSEEPIAGAAETVRWVQSQRIPHLFVTNTTSRGRAALVDKLHRFGIQAELDQILTPCNAAAEWLKTRTDGKAALFINPNARMEFEGVPCASEAFETDVRYIVLGDMEDAWDFHTLNRAFRLLHANPEATLIALGMTRYWRAQDGIRLDAGPFVAALEYATGRKASVMGKPAVPFFRAAAERLGLPGRQTVMVGDDIETDIAGAQKAGLRNVLLQTGKFRPSDLERGITPDAVLNSIADLPAWWESRIADSRLSISD